MVAIRNLVLLSARSLFLIKPEVLGAMQEKGKILPKLTVILLISKTHPDFVILGSCLLILGCLRLTLALFHQKRASALWLYSKSNVTTVQNIRKGENNSKYCMRQMQWSETVKENAIGCWEEKLPGSKSCYFVVILSDISSEMNWVI